MARRKPERPEREAQTPPAPVATPKAAPAWWTWFLAGLAAVFLLGLFATEFADTDSWWHLKTGQYIAKHHLPYPDPFAYTSKLTPGSYRSQRSATQWSPISLIHFNLTHEWLAQTAMYAAYAIGGFPGEILWKALLLVVGCALVGLIVWRRTRSVLWGLAATLAASAALVPFAHDRPSILSYVFPLVFVLVWEDRRRLWLLAPLALLWANCHGGFFLGWVVCGAYCADALVRRLPDWRKALLWSGAAFLVSGINPNGFGVIGTLLLYRNSPMTASLIEWSKPGLWGDTPVFFVLLYSAAIVLALSWRKVRVSDWLLFAAFAAAALSAFRNEPLIGLLAPILIASYFPVRRSLPAIASYAAAAALAAGIVWGIATGAFFQLRAAEWRFPEGAANFLASHRLTGNIFNTYEDGGYLIWRGVPVFIDGRSLSDELFEDYRYVLGAPPGDPRRDQVLDRFGIQTIVLNAFEYNSGTLYPLVLALTQPAESRWKLVYDDAAAMVFVRNLPPGMAEIAKTRVADHAENECFTHVQRDPEFSLCARTLGDLFIQSGDPARARRAFALYLDHPYNGDDPVARQRYLQLAGH